MGILNVMEIGEQQILRQIVLAFSFFVFWIICRLILNTNYLFLHTVPYTKTLLSSYIIVDYKQSSSGLFVGQEKVLLKNQTKQLLESVKDGIAWAN